MMLIRNRLVIIIKRFRPMIEMHVTFRTWMKLPFAHSEGQIHCFKPKNSTVCLVFLLLLSLSTNLVFHEASYATDGARCTIILHLPGLWWLQPFSRPSPRPTAHGTPQPSAPDHGSPGRPWPPHLPPGLPTRRTAAVAGCWLLVVIGGELHQEIHGHSCLPAPLPPPLP